jgi:hypothetical protein
MLRTACCLLLVGLAAPPAAVAAFTLQQPVSPGRQSIVPNLGLGLDWSIFTEASPEPLSFLEGSTIPASEARRIEPGMALVPAVAAGDFEVRAFLVVFALAAFLAGLIPVIPRFHFYRMKLKSLDLPGPLH